MCGSRSFAAKPSTKQTHGWSSSEREAPPRSPRPSGWPGFTRGISLSYKQRSTCLGSLLTQGAGPKIAESRLSQSELRAHTAELTKVKGTNVKHSLALSLCRGLSMDHSPEHAQARSPEAIRSAFSHIPPSRPQALVLWRLHCSLVLLCGQSKRLPFGQEVSEPRERQEKGTG